MGFCFHRSNEMRGPPARHTRLFGVEAKCLQIRGGYQDSDGQTHNEEGSMMGRKSYWKDTYQRELNNFREFGDSGESWFDVSSLVKHLEPFTCLLL
jgi:hypothetical protein